MKLTLLYSIGIVLLVAGCTPAPTKVVSVPTFTPWPTETPLLTPKPTATMTPRQARRARAAKRREERKARLAALTEKRRVAKANAEATRSAEEEAIRVKEAAREAAIYDGKVTADEYERIVVGMPGSKIFDVVGGGKEISSSSIGGITTRMYQWQNPDGSNMIVTTQDGYVISKAQFGIL